MSVLPESEKVVGHKTSLYIMASKMRLLENNTHSGALSVGYAASHKQITHDNHG